MPIDARLALGVHGRGRAGLQQQGFQLIPVVEARAGGALVPGDGVQQDQRLVNDLAFVRGPTGANLPLDDCFVVVRVRVAPVATVIYWQMLPTERYQQIFCNQTPLFPSFATMAVSAFQRFNF